MPKKRQKILFVDDDVSLLEVLKQLMGEFAGDAWEIFTAPAVSEALALLQQQTVDLLVVDIHMPLVDGLQFLNLLQRKYPHVLKVVLTSDATEHQREACLASGAELFLEKPRDNHGWQTVYATLRELGRLQPEEGFRGVLRRVGLQDVLQMECLARSSSVLRIHAGNLQGLIWVKEGQIVHAQCGSRSGEEAFHHLLRLAGGEFEVQPFTPPAEQTISGPWEFLLMEAARQRDESGPSTTSTSTGDTSFPTPPPPPSQRNTPAVVPVLEAPAPAIEPAPALETSRVPPAEAGPQIEELLICSLQGEVLHEWQCSNPNGRVGLLEFISQKARQVAQALPLGEFDRLELTAPNKRVVAQLQSDRALFLRSSRLPQSGAPGPLHP